MTRPDFSKVDGRSEPFPHFRVPELLSDATAKVLLDWLDEGAPWTLRIADFYEQHEFSMLHCKLPAEVEHMVSEAFIADVGRELSERLRAPHLELVDIAAHRLVEGQTIRIHNDQISDDETHRLVVQLNRGWSIEQGGLFMVFERDEPDSVIDVMLPVHRSAFGFEISERSYHAVSTVYSGSRYSLVYTFRRAT
ncbi:cyclophane-containing peptide 2OG-Fe(II) oxygenase YhhC [Acetobacter syzygii]|uniref:cyclophane-containing peptide 2OG-Fe(II) oxygenase YhhC n=1 Tax=Acetobacter syzygii TaxID=146476 RepID=UPI0039EA88DE